MGRAARPGKRRCPPGGARRPSGQNRNEPRCVAARVGGSTSYTCPLARIPLFRFGCREWTGRFRSRNTSGIADAPPAGADRTRDMCIATVDSVRCARPLSTRHLDIRAVCPVPLSTSRGKAPLASDQMRPPSNRPMTERRPKARKSTNIGSLATWHLIQFIVILALFPISGPVGTTGPAISCRFLRSVLPRAPPASHAMAGGGDPDPQGDVRGLRTRPDILPSGDHLVRTAKAHHWPPVVSNGPGAIGCGPNGRFATCGGTPPHPATHRQTWSGSCRW